MKHLNRNLISPIIVKVSVYIMTFRIHRFSTNMISEQLLTSALFVLFIGLALS